MPLSKTDLKQFKSDIKMFEICIRIYEECLLDVCLKTREAVRIYNQDTSPCPGLREPTKVKNQMLDGQTATLLDTWKPRNLSDKLAEVVLITSYKKQLVGCDIQAKENVLDDESPRASESSAASET